MIATRSAAEGVAYGHQVARASNLHKPRSTSGRKRFALTAVTSQAIGIGVPITCHLAVIHPWEKRGDTFQNRPIASVIIMR